jgi:hypothetical protein
MEKSGERAIPKIILIGYEYGLRFHNYLPLFRSSYAKGMEISDSLVGEATAPIKEEMRMHAGIN